MSERMGKLGDGVGAGYSPLTPQGHPCSGLNSVPQKTYIPVLSSVTCVTLFGSRVFADVTS